ncbi:hypothetical protein YC2023_111324 [Brassica napus]
MGGASASLLHPMDTDSAIPRDRDFGRSQFGCEHYKRRCKIRAPCCNLIFPCRHCHNDAANALPDPKERHDLVRQNVKQVICSVCEAEQELKSARTAASVWENTFATSANSLTTRPQKNNFIVTTVGFVELVGVTISFIAKAVMWCVKNASCLHHMCSYREHTNLFHLCSVGSYFFGKVASSFHTLFDPDGGAVLELVIQWACAIITHALRTPLRTLVLSVMRLKFFAMTAIRAAKLCSTFWGTSARIVALTTLAGSQLHKTHLRKVKQSDKFLNLENKQAILDWFNHKSYTALCFARYIK